VPATRQTISNTLSIASQFIPYQNVELHAKVAGYIKNINVDIGDRVHTGQVLAVLEIPELMAQVDEARAGVHHAEEEIQRALVTGFNRKYDQLLMRYDEAVDKALARPLATAVVIMASFCPQPGVVSADGSCVLPPYRSRPVRDQC